jgi:hypothetical protein
MSETASRVSAALVAAQAEIKNPAFDSTNPHFGSQFVSLAGVLDAVRPVLNKHKVAILQPTSTAGTMLQVQTVFLHESGEQISFPPIAMPITDKMTAQQLGSTVTYLRRYSLTAALGVAGQEDDDGNGDAKVRTEPARATASRPAPSEPATARRADHVIAKPAEGKRAPGTAADLVGTVTYVKSEPGEKNGKPYVKTRIGMKPQDGGETLWITSFSETVAETATSVNKTGKVMRAMMGGKSGDLVVDLFEEAWAHVPTTEVFDEQEVPF